MISLQKQILKLYFFYFYLWHSGLFDERTSESKSAILDEFYSRLEAEFARSPGDCKLENVAAVVNVKKA